MAGASSGSTNSGVTPAPGAGGGGAGASATPPAVITVQVPFLTAATYCGTDAGTGAAQTVYNPVLQGTTGCLFAGGLPSDQSSGSKNSLLILPPGLAATLKNGSYTVTRVTLTVTNANQQAAQETLLEVGWAPDASLPATYGAADLAGSAGVVEIPAGAATVTADLTLSQLGLYLQNGTATALVLGPGATPSFGAYNASTGADFYNVIYGPGATDKAGNSLAPYLTVTYAQTTTVQQGAHGGSGAIRVTFVNPAQTLLGSWNNTTGIHAQGGQLTETSVVLGATTKDAVALDRRVIEPTALVPPRRAARARARALGARPGRRLGSIPGAPGAIFGYATGITTIVQASPGTYTFTVPAGITSLSVQCWAGGGGGSGASPPPPGGGGGGGGGYAANSSYAVSPGQVITYVVGAGGAGGTPGFIGFDGENSVFDSTFVAGNSVLALAGLQWLPQFNAGNGGGNPASGLGPGIGTMLFAGGNGGPQAGQSNGAGGGGSAGEAGNGGGGNVGGSGGDGGAGGGAAGGNGGFGSGDGSGGSAPGGGGGGGGSASSTTGGDGGSGQVIISYINSITLAHTFAVASGTDALGNSYAAGLTTTQATAGTATVTGVLTATGGTPSSPTVVLSDTWHTASLLNNWTGSGGGVNGIRYRLTASQQVEVEGDIINTVSSANSAAATLPAGYRAPASRNFPAAWNNPVSSNSSSVPWINTDTSGDISVVGQEADNVGIFFHIFIPLT